MVLTYTNISQILLERLYKTTQKNSYEIFEQYSHYIKQKKYNYTSNENYVDAYKLREKFAEVEDELERCAKYYNLIPKAEADDDGEPAEPAQIGYVPDMLEELQL